MKADLLIGAELKADFVSGIRKCQLPIEKLAIQERKRARKNVERLSFASGFDLVLGGFVFLSLRLCVWRLFRTDRGRGGFVLSFGLSFGVGFGRFAVAVVSFLHFLFCVWRWVFCRARCC